MRNLSAIDRTSFVQQFLHSSFGSFRSSLFQNTFRHIIVVLNLRWRNYPAALSEKNPPTFSSETKTRIPVKPQISFLWEIIGKWHTSCAHIYARCNFSSRDIRIIYFYSLEKSKSRTKRNIVARKVWFLQAHFFLVRSTSFNLAMFLVINLLPNAYKVLRNFSSSFILTLGPSSAG